MNQEPHIEQQEKDLPRWVQVPAGLVLALFTLLCAFASVEILLSAPKPTSVLGIVAISILLLGCLWVLAKCIRLITGRKHRGGLLGPVMLRAVSIFLLVAPIAGFFTGYYRRIGALAILQVVMYFFGFLGLRAMARKRESEEEKNDPPSGTPE